MGRTTTALAPFHPMGKRPRRILRMRQVGLRFGCAYFDARRPGCPPALQTGHPLREKALSHVAKGLQAMNWSDLRPRSPGHSR